MDELVQTHCETTSDAYMMLLTNANVDIIALPQKPLKEIYCPETSGYEADGFICPLSLNMNYTTKEKFLRGDLPCSLKFPFNIVWPVGGRLDNYIIHPDD